MTAAELKELIVKNGLHPVPVLNAGGDSEDMPRFEGTLDEFWAAAKALSSKVVFLQVHQMDEDDLKRPVSNEDSYRPGEEDEGDIIDLEEVAPSMSKFRKHLGKDCAFILTAKGGFADIDYLLTEPWWDEFQQEASRAVDTWTERREAEKAEESAENEKKNDELLKQLRALIGDKEFCRLRTQRAMLAYALEKLPELEELEEFVLKPEIQTLHARIEARGLNKASRD